MIVSRPQTGIVGNNFQPSACGFSVHDFSFVISHLAGVSEARA
jgi:hypothetical protein